MPKENVRPDIVLQLLFALRTGSVSRNLGERPQHRKVETKEEPCATVLPPRGYSGSERPAFRILLHSVVDKVYWRGQQGCGTCRDVHWKDVAKVHNG